MERAAAPTFPRTAENLPKFTDPNVASGEVCCGILSALKQVTTWTMDRAQRGASPTRDLQLSVDRVFMSWVKYWAAQASYVNEIKTVKLPTTPGNAVDEQELDENGKRRIRESMSYQMVASLFPFYCVGTYKEESEHGAWSLDRTTQPWWLDEWGTLVVNPPSLEETSAALIEYRLENERKRREEEKKGPEKGNVISEPPQKEFEAAFEQYEKDVVLTAEKVMDAAALTYNRRLLWYRPVSQYTQRNIYDAVMLLTERVNEYPFHQEFVYFVQLLTMRLGYLLLFTGPAETFDIPRYRVAVPSVPAVPLVPATAGTGTGAIVPNSAPGNVPTSAPVSTGAEEFQCSRVFIQWAACYFYELWQRIHYAQHMMCIPLEKKATTANVDALREQVAHICRNIGLEDFMAMYKVSVDEYYEFPGDQAFGRFLHPEGIIDMGDLLLELRQERQAARYFSEASLNSKTILARVLSGKTHLARLFLLNVIDRYFSTEVNVAWRDAVVVDQQGIALSQNKLIESTMPCLVSIFSIPLLNFEFHVLVTDDIYQSIAEWLVYVYVKKKGFLYRTNIKLQIKQLLGKIKAVKKRQKNTETGLDEPACDYNEIFDANGNLTRPL